MKLTKQRFIKLALAFATASVFMGAQAAVSLSVSVGEPGFFGTLDISNAPPPVVYSAQPVIVTGSATAASQPPIYVHVPPEQRRNWKRNCARYDACGRPVYFVKENWYQKSYVPSYRKNHGSHEGHSQFEGSSRGLPPGLAKKEGGMPPGLAKKEGRGNGRRGDD